MFTLYDTMENGLPVDQLNILVKFIMEYVTANNAKLDIADDAIDMARHLYYFSGNKDIIKPVIHHDDVMYHICSLELRDVKDEDGNYAGFTAKRYTDHNCCESEKPIVVSEFDDLDPADDLTKSVASVLKILRNNQPNVTMVEVCDEDYHALRQLSDTIIIFAHILHALFNSVHKNGINANAHADYRHDTCVALNEVAKTVTLRDSDGKQFQLEVEVQIELNHSETALNSPKMGYLQVSTKVNYIDE